VRRGTQQVKEGWTREGRGCKDWRVPVGIAETTTASSMWPRAAEPAASAGLRIGTPTGLAEAIGTRGLLCAVCLLPLQFVNH